MSQEPPWMTLAQRRALDWLTEDWQIDPGAVAQAIKSLSFMPGRYVESSGGAFGKRGGWKWRYRLTAAGLALKESQNDVG